jgi:hypothetical protein
MSPGPEFNGQQPMMSMLRLIRSQVSPMSHMHITIPPPTRKMALRLNPWKDGYIVTRNCLEHEDSSSAKTVYVTFHEDEFVEYLNDGDAVALFEAIGSCLPRLESVIIILQVSSKLPSLAIPPIQALTSLLVVGENNNKIKYLTLLNLRLEGSDLDMNGMIEAIRIHPSLHSVVVKNCIFSSNHHIHLLRNTLTSREEMKHCDLLDNHIVVVERARNRRLWRFILYFLLGCILTITILLGLGMSSSHDNFPITKTVVDYLPAGMMPKFEANLATENQKRKGLWRRLKNKQKSA